MACVKKNVLLLQAFQRHDQDSWCRIVWHNLWRWIACVTFLLHETCLLLVSLFYGKCYVTIFIREYVAFSYRYWGKFLPKQNEKKLSRIMFFHRKRRFCFFFSFVFRIDFFLSVSFRFILYFFLGRQWLDGFCWFCDLLFFHSYEKT